MSLSVGSAGNKELEVNVCRLGGDHDLAVKNMLSVMALNEANISVSQVCQACGLAVIVIYQAVEKQLISQVREVLPDGVGEY